MAKKTPSVEQWLRDAVHTHQQAETDLHEAILIALYPNSGVKQATVAQLTGYSREHLRRLARENGIPSAKTASEQFLQDMTEITDSYVRARTNARIDRYRPVLAAAFGEDIAARVLDDPGLHDVADALGDEHGIEVDEVARLVAQHLQQHPDATMGEAYDAARQAAAERDDADE
ncbi:hypothetical protein [Actinomadura hibisca]|uniref:hypothetical protein n=1 Tax=Actinomadura hibisca TaxID=68565 RepID=UPI00082D6520|nr:hypothetical protein [Actinomadura hibisca]